MSFFGRRHDGRLVDIDARQARDVRAGRDHDRLRFEDLLVAVLALDHDLAGRADGALAGEGVDLVLLEQEGDAVDVGGDGLVLVLHHAREVELRLDHDAEMLHPVRGLGEHLGGVEQRLRRDAADIEAGSAERVALLDDADLQPELRGADGADIAAGAGAYHDDVVGHLFSR
jgi:hypothetical protein